VALYQLTLAQFLLRVDPFELAMYEDWEPLGPRAPQEVRVILFGDSRIREWPVPVHMPGYTVHNRGKGYQSTEQLLGRFEADVASQSPSVVVLQAGVNDLRAAVMQPERRAKTVARCKQNLHTLIARVQAAGATPIVLTLFSTGRSMLPAPFTVDDLTLSQLIADVNASLLTEAGSGVLVLDSARILDASDGHVRAAFSRDQLHINAQGYALLQTALQQALARMHSR
jgi:lysophospholipase L1-like esterase